VFYVAFIVVFNNVNALARLVTVFAPHQTPLTTIESSVILLSVMVFNLFVAVQRCGLGVLVVAVPAQTFGLLFDNFASEVRSMFDQSALQECAGEFRRLDFMLSHT
jgi:hypothetical protein